MSGPVTTEDTVEDAAGPATGPPRVDVTPSREADVSGLPVRRALPRRDRRTVGAWCFADHMGPVPAAQNVRMEVGPHPHIGLQTVTWLLAGEAVHRDSLGSEQVIRPGQLNLMTAGHGVSHAEESPGGYRGELHGIQLWVAQPDATRNDPPAFEHHGELPQLELGDATASVLVGEFGGVTSPARRDTDHVGVQLELHGAGAELPLHPAYEYALVVLSGAVLANGTGVKPGELAYLGAGRAQLDLRGAAARPTRVLLLGGEPFEARPLMWWNFVARTRQEIDAARSDWLRATDRFGETGSQLSRIPAPATPWNSSDSGNR